MAFNIEEIIVQAAQQYNVDPQLAWSIAKAESNFNPNAVSPKGAVGIMQMTPDAATVVGYSWKDMYDPVKNIHAGIRYLKRLLDQFGDIDIAVAAYNAGPGYMSTIITRYGSSVSSWFSRIYDETRGFIRNVQTAYQDSYNNPMFRRSLGPFAIPNPVDTIWGAIKGAWNWLWGTEEEVPVSPVTPEGTIATTTTNILPILLVGTAVVLLLSYTKEK